MKTIGFIDTLNDQLLLQKLREYIGAQRTKVELFEAPSFQTATLQNADVVLVNQNQINTPFILELKKFCHKQSVPLLLAATQVPVTSYQQLTDLRRLLVLQKPFAPGVLESLLNKVFAGDLLVQDCLPRFLTNEPVRVIDTRTGLLLQTTMKNYSPTGAFLEYKGISVRVGSRLKLEFVNNRDHSNSRLRYEAKVIWIKGEHGSNGYRGVGVQFYNDVQL